MQDEMKGNVNGFPLKTCAKGVIFRLIGQHKKAGHFKALSFVKGAPYFSMLCHITLY